jgi:hypothetical protein
MFIFQATGEASSPQREHPALLNNTFFIFLWDIFAKLDPVLDQHSQRLRIQPTKINADPDLQPCL